MVVGSSAPRCYPGEAVKAMLISVRDPIARLVDRSIVVDPLDERDVQVQPASIGLEPS